MILIRHIGFAASIEGTPLPLSNDVFFNVHNFSCGAIKNTLFYPILVLAEDDTSLYDEDAAAEAAAAFARACAPDTQKLLAPPARQHSYMDRRLIDDHDQ